MVVGYDASQGFLIRNSWGTLWGNNGYTWFPFSDWGLQHECWSSLNFVDPNRKKIIDETIYQEQMLITAQKPNNNNTFIFIISGIFLVIVVLIIFSFNHKKPVNNFKK